MAATFKIEKLNDYTVMANHHLRNRKLSLKAKGLQSLMLSLPEEWDYSLKGLAAICKDGVDSISSTLRELEEAGYVSRKSIRYLTRNLPKAMRTKMSLKGKIPIRLKTMMMHQRLLNLNRKNPIR